MTEQQEKCAEIAQEFAMSKYASQQDRFSAMLQRIATLEATNAAQAEQLANLESALRRLYRGYVNTVENGRSRIIDLGGECDPVDVMEQSDPLLIEMRALLQSSAPAEPQAGVELTDERKSRSVLDLWSNPLFSVEQRLDYAVAEVRDLRRLLDAASRRHLNQRQAVKAEPKLFTEYNEEVSRMIWLPTEQAESKEGKE